MPAGTALETHVAVSDLRKVYRTADREIAACDGVSLELKRGQTCALVGPSGSGKSTLLHLLGALDRPDSGSITVGGAEIAGLRGAKAAAYRRGVGFVFQRYNLLGHLDVLDNVLAPLLPFHPSEEDRRRAVNLLDAVGLAGRERQVASRLSGGQQQRVAIARALVNRPHLVLADEPTGSLDTATGEQVLGLLLDLARGASMTLVIATHDTSVAAACDRVVEIRDGRLVA